MARIAGINIPPHQHAEIGLTAIFGIGRSRARMICEAAGVAFNKKVKDLSDAEVEKLLYELRYELQNRPDWLVLPWRDVCSLALED